MKLASFAGLLPALQLFLFHIYASHPPTIIDSIESEETLEIKLLSAKTHNDSDLSAREIDAFEKSGLKVRIWGNRSCGGKNQHDNNVEYGENNNYDRFYSFMLSRDLLEGEQLDFSERDGDINIPGWDEKTRRTLSKRASKETDCAVFISSADVQTSVGNVCHDLPRKARCFRLWHH